MKSMVDRDAVRRRIHVRIRKRVKGSAERPRLAVFRSLNHIYAQVIDDRTGRTLAAASSAEKASTTKSGGNVAAAKEVGIKVAERAKQAGIAKVVFDRGGFLYHGRVKALADAARVLGCAQPAAPRRSVLADPVACDVGADPAARARLCRLSHPVASPRTPGSLSPQVRLILVW